MRSADGFLITPEGKVVDVNLPAEGDGFLDRVHELIHDETAQFIKSNIPGVLLLVADNGKLMGMEWNKAASLLLPSFPHDVIVGNCLCFGERGEDIVSLSSVARLVIRTRAQYAELAADILMDAAETSPRPTEVQHEV